AEKNLATQENYQPGSIWKPVVAIACLEHGLDPNAEIDVIADPTGKSHSAIKVGNKWIGDTVPPGKYDFHRALLRSSNTYFISNGMRCGLEYILQVAHRAHFGERIGMPTRQETSGILPSEDDIHTG